MDYLFGTSIEKKIKLLGDGEYINCFLVEQGVRGGYLFQTIDYGEYDIESPISRQKLSLMNKFFPSLIQTPNRQGVLLSKKEFPLEAIEDDISLGKILGFPCDLLKVLQQKKADDISTSVVQINIHFFNGKSISIISFKCTDIDTQISQINDLVDRIRESITESELSKIIKDVKLNITTDISEFHLIKLLSTPNTKFEKKETHMLNEYLENIGFSEKFTDKSFHLNNPIHRGILIGLLAYSKYPLLEPFYPLQNYGKDKPNEVEIQTEKFEDFLNESIKLSSGLSGMKKNVKKTKKKSGPKKSGPKKSGPKKSGPKKSSRK